MLRSYLAAFALTLAVEVPIYAAGLAAIGVGWVRAVWYGCVVNLVTHPPLWWTMRPLSVRPAYPGLLLGAELAVCAVEWALLVLLTGRTSPRVSRRPDGVLSLAVLSLTANAASTLAGLLLAGW